MDTIDNTLHPIGYIRSTLKLLEDAPRQGNEGAPDAWIDIAPEYTEAMVDLTVGENIIVITWFHQAQRDILKVHPRNDETIPLTGIFSTRSPDRPNPLGLHRVKILAIMGNLIQVAPIEAIDGTPIVDIKPVLTNSADF
jgi:tRNA-Thr(GGU) m(6)t(6)A37 methyltransferase TsaA